MFDENAKTIAVIGTLDTKEEEISYLKACMEDQGAKAFIIDVGYRPNERLQADIKREEVMESSSTDWAQPNLGRKEVIEGLADGMRKLLPKLYDEGMFEGVISIGGAQNTNIAVSGMQQLAIGIPKVMVSTVACGGRKFEDVVGTKDIFVMPAIADIAGINPITSVVIKNAASAVVGMVNNLEADTAKTDQIKIGSTLMGVVDPGSRQLNKILAKNGMVVTNFHSTGIGGKVMEELIEADTFDGVVDFSLHEITSEYFGEGYSVGADNRLTAAAEKGIPQVIVPGTIDFIDFDPAQMPDHMKDRPMIYHNSKIVHIKLSPDEMRDIAGIICKRLNPSKGPVSVVVPTGGFRSQTEPGEALYDEAADKAFIETLSEGLGDHIRLTLVNANINDQVFSEAVAKETIRMMEMTGKMKNSMAEAVSMNDGGMNG